MWFSKILMFYIRNMILSYQGMFDTQMSGDKTSSGESGFNMKALTSTKVGQNRCLNELASSVCMPHPFQMFYGNLAQLEKKNQKQ